MAAETFISTDYVLSRLNWRRTPAGFIRLPGETRFASFPTREEADAERWRLERLARAVVNPFAAGPAPYEQSHLPPEVLRDWLLEAGIDPPPAPADDWAGWWAAAAPGWTDAQRDRAWEALDKVRFYRVEGRPKRPVVFVITEVCWNYHDYEFAADGEGGKAVVAYRSRARAEAECERRNAEHRDNYADMNEEDLDDPDSGRMDYNARERLLADPFADPPPQLAGDNWKLAAEVPFFEVVEVELEWD